MNAVMAGRLFVISEHCAPRPSVRRRGATSCAVTIAYRSDIHRVANPVILIGPRVDALRSRRVDPFTAPHFRFCAWRPPIGGRGELDRLPLSRRSAARRSTIRHARCARDEQRSEPMSTIKQYVRSTRVIATLAAALLLSAAIDAASAKDQARDRNDQQQERRQREQGVIRERSAHAGCVIVDPRRDRRAREPPHRGGPVGFR